MKLLLKLSLINCGFITDYLSYKYFKLSNKSLTSLVSQGLLKKDNYIIYGKLTTIYTMSDKYIDIARNEGYYIYKHDSTQLEHDYLLLKVFLSIPDQCKITWKNETSLKYKFGETITTDAVFTKDNQIVGVEILTPSYDKDKINEKMSFISTYCDNSIILNTKDFSRR